MFLQIWQSKNFYSLIQSYPLKTNWSYDERLCTVKNKYVRMCVIYT